MSVPRRLLIFCRRPEYGGVKTRLMPAIGGVGALKLHRLLLRDTLARLGRTRDCDVDLVVTDERHPLFRFAVAEYGVGLRRQQGRDLGMRMAHAAAAALRTAGAVVIVGSDSPDLDADYVARAFGVLEQGADLVLGPAADGGYVLIGMRRSLPCLFTDMPWGSDAVLATTRGRAADAGLSIVELPGLWDVDTAADLPRLWRCRPRWRRMIEHGIGGANGAQRNGSADRP